MLRPSRAQILFLLLTTLFLALAGLTNGVPIRTSPRSSITRRREHGHGAFRGPKNLQTSKTTDSEFGPVIEDCKITLTPLVGPEGEDLVREDRFCTVTVIGDDGGDRKNGNNDILPPDISEPPPPDLNQPPPPDLKQPPPPDSKQLPPPPDTSGEPPPPDNGGGPPPPNGGNSSASADGSQATPPPSGGDQGNTSTPANVQSSASDGGSPSSASGPDSTPAPSSTPDPSSLAGPSGNGGSSNQPAPDPSAAASSPAPGDSQPTDSPTPTSGGSSDPAQSASGSPAAEQSSSGTPFSLPGQKLQVLPIGLGVFAGISVIALIVVGLVTYERTKYRKAFRQRRLAEQGQTPGYGGMAERPS